MDSDRIEKLGTTAIERLVLKYPNLKPFVKENDKTPFFDGRIQVYRENDYLGDVDIQIKSKEVEVFTEREITHALSVKDLKSFRNQGGVLFFVVELQKTLSRVFYETLLPADIENIFKQLKAKTKKEKYQI